MKTDDFITALSEDRVVRLPMSRAWRFGVPAAAVLCAVAFFLLLGPRPDFATATASWRFLFKFVVTGLLAFGSLLVVLRVAEPGADWRARIGWLTLAPLLLVAAAAMEMMLLPDGERMQRMIGTNNMLCLISIPAIGLPGLAALIAVLRYGAPVEPGRAGALAGVLAGGIAATFYAAHCTDDSPLFVMLWYTLAIAALAIIGAVMGRIFVRW